MILHLFNPENDMALASFAPHFIPPRSARVMAADLSVLPAWWAGTGDAVLVDGEERGRQFAALPASGLCARVQWVVPDGCAGADAVRPWGWSPLLVQRLLSGGCPSGVLPDEAQLRRWRSLSHRSSAVRMLAELTAAGAPLQRDWGRRLCGRSWYCTAEADIVRRLNDCPDALLKAPWSGSGKGLRMGRTGYVPPLSGWCRRLLHGQGGVVVEPIYDKAYDFAFEFEADGQGGARYCGLSVFFTSPRGTYAGNWVAPEEVKERWLARHLPAGMPDALRREVGACVARIFARDYCGPLGVDMMLCRVPGRDGLCVHPCVEVNLRNTMGRVAGHLARLLAPGCEGRFVIDFFRADGEAQADTLRRMRESPPGWTEGRVSSGFLSLTPVNGATHYRASLQAGGSCAPR